MSQVAGSGGVLTRTDCIRKPPWITKIQIDGTERVITIEIFIPARSVFAHGTSREIPFVIGLMSGAILVDIWPTG